MSVMLRRDEVRDLLDVHFTLTVGRYIGDLVTAADVASLGSTTLSQAVRELPRPPNGGYSVEDILQLAVKNCMALVAKVDTKGEDFISLKEIEALATNPAANASELAGLIYDFYHQLADWKRVAAGGADVAAGLGALAHGERAMIVANSEGDSLMLPYCASVPGKTLRAASRADVCHALTLSESDLDGGLVTDYASAAAFLQELSADDNSKPLANALQKQLRELRVVLLGSIDAPAEWDWKLIIDAVVRSDCALLARFLGAEATPKQLARFLDADDDPNGADLQWNMSRVPVLVAGTARDGALVGLIGCLTWT